MGDTVESSDGPKCPYCGHVHSDPESWGGVVTLWGSERRESFECEQCDLTFEVYERVQRYWESTPVVQETARDE